MKNTINFIILTMLFSNSIAMGYAKGNPSSKGDGSGELKVQTPLTKRKKYADGELIIKFKESTDENTIAQIYKKHKLSSIKKRLSSRLKFSTKKRHSRRMKLSSNKSVVDAVNALKDDPNVEYAEPNYIAYKHLSPNDTYYPFQWHLDGFPTGGIGMEAAWDITMGNIDTIVAVIGTGVAYEDYSESKVVRGTTINYTYALAPDLAQTNFVAGYDFVNDDTHANDDEGHETHVTGTIAQSTNNGTGLAGVAPDVSIMPLKALGSDGSGTYDDIVKAIHWAVDHGAHVINMSLGGSSSAQSLEDACKYAYDAGVTIIASSGNDGTNIIGWPAAYNAYVIAVGATRFDEARSGYSNYGTGLDIVAPGGDTRVDQNGDGYVDGVLQQTFSPVSYNRNTQFFYDAFGYYFYQGTSMAAPHVAGVAALLISTDVAKTPDDVREALQSTAKDLGTPGWDSQTAWGLLNAKAALEWNAIVVEENKSPVVSNIPDQSIEQGLSFSTINLNDYVTDLDSDISWSYSGNTELLVSIDGNNIATVFAPSPSWVGTENILFTAMDPGGLNDSDSATFTITAPSEDMELFNDSFELNEWNGLWTEDSQNDWRRTSQRTSQGTWSAEVDGKAKNATLTTWNIDMQGKTNAVITFDWYIEKGLDRGEYLKFDTSADGGSTWVQRAELQGNVDIENQWHSESIRLSGIYNLRLRFTGNMSNSREDAFVDAVKVIGN